MGNGFEGEFFSHRKFIYRAENPEIEIDEIPMIPIKLIETPTFQINLS